ncbi:GNAT family N-acetyltransferase [Kribbella capetownensis]|uniref:GNAT family N-acetyltransferase n=1 Tax=Kribbella capetownensis TaxID=1572659 RepID=UPI0013F45464|nr:GNAT family protein [Kribbella capetownensis]
MSTVTAAEFTWPLGDDAVLIPRTVAIAEAHFALVEANYQRLAQWFGDAYQEPPVLDETRANLVEAGQGWLDGSLLPLSIAVKADNGWRLVGWAQLEIDRRARSAEIGYWLDTDFVGRGLISRTVTAVLDHAFGPLGLLRVRLCTTIDNTRSRNVAERMGFTQEGVLREAAVFPTERRDLVIYGLLAREWRPPARVDAPPRG